MQTRNTVQKRVISEQLHAMGNHPTVDEVYVAVRAQLPSISKATVYRTLKSMADAGTALRVPVAGGAEHFDHRTDPHSHVICDECGRVADVELSYSASDIDWASVCDSSGYEITGHSMQFTGVCPLCQSAKRAG